MYVDESLAKGLTSRLWYELDELERNNSIEYSRYLTTHKIKLGSRKVIEKLDKAHRLLRGAQILSHSFSGTRKQPTAIYALLNRDKEAKKNSWVERMFLIELEMLTSQGRTIKYPPIVRIGEHAVSRIFQRNLLTYDQLTNKINLAEVVAEFLSIAMFAWTMSDLYTTLHDFMNDDGIEVSADLTIPFVSKHGLFLGRLDTSFNFHPVDIRTFVDDGKLASQQLNLVEKVRKNFNVPLIQMALMPLVGLELVAPFIKSLSEIADEFAELATWNIEELGSKKIHKDYVIKVLTVTRL